jgi:RNA recognition motif-containing protein
VHIINITYEYFVGSLPFSIEEADLRESFEAYGAVDSVKIITDKFTGRKRIRFC